MQTSIEKQPDRRATSWAQDARNLLMIGLRHRLVLASAGIAVAGGGLVLGWDWLAAVGVAPLIVAAAPCLIMCALGMCMMGRGNQPGSSKSVQQIIEEDAQTTPPGAP